jgi:ABC-type transport system substrate-binding protein
VLFRSKCKAKVAIVVDSLASTSETVEEQIEGIVDHLRYIGVDVTLTYSGTDIWDFTDKQKHVDLLIIDYGGLWATPGISDSVAVDPIREACEYAENHPSTLLVIWTFFTKQAYEFELESEFGHLTNISTVYAKNSFGGDSLGDKELLKWLGVGE